MSQISTSSETSVLPSPHVLLVEDNIIALHFIEAIITQAGLTFTSAKNGEEALQLLQSQVFDIIITDIGLPDISGYELTRQIRQWEKEGIIKPLPIIGLTAFQDAEEKCLQAGMNEMLHKPITSQVLNKLIDQYLRD